MINKQKIIETLKTILDPEIGIDIWTLGLIYDIEINEKEIQIKMTLTSPMCPYGPMLIEEVKDRISSLQNVKNVKVELVFDPPWKPTSELREILGI